MPYIQGSKGEIHELARYEVRPEALERCIAAMHEFVAYVRANEPGALRYEVWQESAHPTRFVHLFVWKDEEANRIHGESAAVKKFASPSTPTAWLPWSSSNTRKSTLMPRSGAFSGRSRKEWKSPA
ncbi:MAG TPA: antibiotic biosynthesis monooxygenase family protein [Gemmatimonadales bacterium]|nr:antibiotic biosynthesis monooxygenase family protein [Gemmatimonadales bacterium]